ncbi:MAG: hypothetical protein EI684_11300 [Candidatus Viridilinea halotolerans]|uniref:Uncharacterized protein n=1 Tax=Candidatus Viridilinea halotolerans TaxID=2491704 RepID=A0A426TZ99_9CHLR|nr:MAG: hypothetical protein EI684_11300 [Candidatus Viridilinea halotolerans]
MQQSRRNKSGNASSWLGWLIFFLLIFGSNFLPPIARWLTQQTGVSVTPSAIIAGVIGLSVLVSVATTLFQAVNRGREANETRLPTSLPTSIPTNTTVPPPLAPSTSMRLPSATMGEAQIRQRALGEQKLPPPPQFEPIINPRVFALGLVGLLFFGGCFGLLLLVAGGI